MKTVSILYNDLPVTITDEDIKQFTGLDLEREIAGNSTSKITTFLDTVHEQIYHFLIFTTGDKLLKIKIINKYKDQLEKPIKIALLTQANYLISNGNIEIFNGAVKSANGIDMKEMADIIEKVLAPTVINILSSTKPNILYAGR